MTSALVRFGAALWALVIPLCLLAPYPVRCFDALPLSSSPLVRDFPHPSQRSGCLGVPGPRRTHRVKCVINRPQASGSLFDEARRSLFPSRRGFILHTVYQASLAPSHKYNPRICHALPPTCSGSAFTRSVLWSTRQFHAPEQERFPG